MKFKSSSKEFRRKLISLSVLGIFVISILSSCNMVGCKYDQINPREKGKDRITLYKSTPEMCKDTITINGSTYIFSGYEEYREKKDIPEPGST